MTGLCALVPFATVQIVPIVGQQLAHKRSADSDSSQTSIQLLVWRFQAMWSLSP